VARRKRRKRRTVPGREQRQPSAELQRTLRRAERLIEQGRAWEVIELLEPLLASYPRVADLHYYLGFARALTGHMWPALGEYERAVELSRDADYLVHLGALYLEVELYVHALRTFRMVSRRHPDNPAIDNVRQAVDGLGQDLAGIADRLGIPVSQAEKGRFRMEEALRALHEKDYAVSIAASRRAIPLLPGWPPPLNNLSLALFLDGQPEDAVATARQVLSHDPDNVQALSNGTRFLAWTGEETEARALWAQLQEVTPRNPDQRLKIAEAAAALGEDERVFQLLRPLDVPDVEQDLPPGLDFRARFFLAVAQANTNRRGARRAFRDLRDGWPQLGVYAEAVEAGQPGLGWAERFPYFHMGDLMPEERMEEFMELLGREEDLPPDRFRTQVDRFVARFPQIVLVAEKLIWEETQPDAGVDLLAVVDNPTAHAALRRFALSQAGDDEVRMRAINILADAGEIADGSVLRLWNQGQWREVEIRRVEISGEPETQYTPQVSRLLRQALEAHQRDDQDEAERLFLRMVELEPRAREAYNNLGAICARRGDHAQAREMFQAAVEIDPGYVFPRCNLATYLLDEGDIEGAEAMLEPLSRVPRFHPQEMAFYSYTQARILMRREEHERARRALELALQVYPGYEPAQNLLDRLTWILQFEEDNESFWEQQRRRDQAKRARLQAQLSTRKPTLAGALPLYTKDALTGMARVTLRFGGWSALRKAELIERIIAALTHPEELEYIVAELDDEERDGLRLVLSYGGHMSWLEFDAVYGNDLDESPDWNWHPPETSMGRLRLSGLLVETTVNGELLVAVPSELRRPLREILA